MNFVGLRWPLVLHLAQAYISNQPAATWPSPLPSVNTLNLYTRVISHFLAVVVLHLEKLHAAF